MSIYIYVFIFICECAFLRGLLFINLINFDFTYGDVIVQELEGKCHSIYEVQRNLYVSALRKHRNILGNGKADRCHIVPFLLWFNIYMQYRKVKPFTFINDLCLLRKYRPYLVHYSNINRSSYIDTRRSPSSNLSLKLYLITKKKIKKDRQFRKY
jgi:hypothetical protein